jgi:hypothetical protein
MLDRAKAPAEVLQDQGRGGTKCVCTDDPTSRKQKRKLGSVWREGRYLYRSGPNGSAVFDTWTWTGEPLLRSRS